MTPEQIERLKELLGYDHDDISAWSVREMQDLACALLAEWEEQGHELDKARVQLAGCGVAATCGTASEQQVKRTDYGWSASYQAVLDLQMRYEGRGREIERLKDQVELHREGHRRQWHARREAEENSQRDGARAEQAEARLARVVEATLALISAVDAQIKPDKYMVGRLGQARANALAAAQPEQVEKE